MRTKELSSGVLVYDRYYTAKPHAVLLTLKKTLICCALAVFSMMYIFVEYEFDISLLLMALVTAAFSVGFSVLFVFVKKRFAIPAMLFVAGLYLWRNYKELWKSFSYFVDEAMMLTEGRFLFPRGHLFHDAEQLTAYNPFYNEGMMMGCCLLCGLYALVCAASMSKRPRVMPPLLVFIGLCVPRFISETLEFNVWLLPTLAVFAGVAAVSAGYSGGLAMCSSSRKNALKEEKSFRKKAQSAGYVKRVSMSASFYSKYFAVAVYCAALFAISAGFSAKVFGMGSSIDYSNVYEFIMNIGEESGVVVSPFENGPAADFFTNPRSGESHSELNISSPGTGEQEIIRVSFNGDRPIYLRGDIGVRFTGKSWTSPVKNEPDDWFGFGLDKDYRPCEMRVAHSLMTTMGYSAEDFIVTSDITIDYLCDSSVVFLPPYTSEYSYHNNDRFNVYGDIAVRVNEDYGSVNTVQCTALVPLYVNTDSSMDNHGAAGGIAFMEKCFEESYCTMDSIYSSVVPEMFGTSGVFSAYDRFVKDNYTEIPYELSTRLSGFMGDSGIYGAAESAVESYKSAFPDAAVSDAQSAYLKASAVADFLRDNYTYSLTAPIDRDDPVMSFLNDVKSGHCSLYASAMTLIMRELGVPARYCTGFAVDPANSVSPVTLRSKNLHAWCEVYIGQLGWVTFDPTSSSVYPNNNPVPPSTSTAQATTAATSSTPPSTSVPSRPEITGVTEEAHASTTAESVEIAESVFDIKPYLPYIAAGVGLILTAAAAVAAVCSLKELNERARRGLNSLKKDNPGSAAPVIYQLLLESAEVCEISPEGGELPNLFYKRLDRQMGTRLSERTALLEAIAFGSYGADSAERDWLAKQLENLVCAADKSVGLARRIKIRKILAKK